MASRLISKISVRIKDWESCLNLATYSRTSKTRGNYFRKIAKVGYSGYTSLKTGLAIPGYCWDCHLCTLSLLPRRCKSPSGRWYQMRHNDVIKWKHFPRYWPAANGTELWYFLRLNKRLSEQSWRRWFETPSRSLWRHCNESYVATGSTDVIPCHLLQERTIEPNTKGIRNVLKIKLE